MEHKDRGTLLTGTRSYEIIFLSKLDKGGPTVVITVVPYIFKVP